MTLPLADTKSREKDRPFSSSGEELMAFITNLLAMPWIQRSQIDMAVMGKGYI